MIPKGSNYSISVLGAGQIGSKIYELMAHHQGTVRLFDANPRHPSVWELDVTNPKALLSAIETSDVVISALPYGVTGAVAKAVIELGDRVYLDLTEDVETGKMIRAYNAKVDRGSIMIPHCGLAPGAVSIIAGSMMHEFEKVDSVTIRVGALPIASDNRLLYHRSWSTDGLVNEYTKPCKAIVGGEEVQLQPLEGLTSINLDGSSYEAFNTSGGCGTLNESLSSGMFPKFSKTGNMKYQTIRYPGHRDQVKFLLDDMGFRTKLKHLVKHLDEHVPRTFDDVVVIMIQVHGRYLGNDNFTKTYQRKIYGDARGSAIQKTTAGGIAAVADYVIKLAGSTPDVLKHLMHGNSPSRNTGWIATELIPVSELYDTLGWSSYR